MDYPDNEPSTSRFRARKRPLTATALEKALQDCLDELSNEDSVEDFDDDDDDSIADKNYVCSDSESDALDQQSENTSHSSESEENNDVDNIQTNTDHQNNNYTWNLVSGLHQKVFQFDDQFGINPNIDVANISIADSYKLFVTDDILEVMVTETNRNAEQVIRGKGVPKKKSRLQMWKPTNLDEMKKFLGLLLYMGLVRYPKIPCYWSKANIYKNSITSQIMARNRFQSLLRFWHFSDNASPDAAASRTHKIDVLVSFLNSKYKEILKPDQYIAVDETMIPFRGRLGFRQYIPGKRHKYGVKLFKMCDRKGYTHSFSVYQGKHEREEGKSLSTDVVLKLCEDHLDHGRVVITDNFYTSIPLAQELLKRKTHTVGTLRKNRKGVPREVTLAKLKKGEICGRENEDGIVVAKWKDKRDVFILSTYHNLEIANTGKKNRQREEIYKPQCIIDYNTGKAGIDLSDQLSSYSTCVRKSLRWYHKVATELFMGTTVVNGLIVYRMGNPGKTISVTSYREALVNSLLNLDIEKDGSQTKKSKHGHVIKETDQKCKRNRKIRKRCIICYQKISAQQGFKVAVKLTKKVNTFCSTCPEKPFVCINCFPHHI